MSAHIGVHGTGPYSGGHREGHRGGLCPLCPPNATAQCRHVSRQNLMEKKPLMSHNRTYGLVNPGYVVTAETAPAMFVSPATCYPGPSSPPAGMFDLLPGYEHTIGIEEVGFAPPPMPATPVQPPLPGPEEPQWNIPSISEDTARDAFIQYASDKCCYSTAPAKHGAITGMEAFNTYRYKLETFTESRSVEWAHEPFCGQTADAFTQPPPGPWDIPTQAPTFFHNSKKVIKIPNTSSVKNCYICLGMGRKPCTCCGGAGSNVCGACSGRGFHFGGGGQCMTCNRRGRQKCATAALDVDQHSVQYATGSSNFWCPSSSTLNGDGFASAAYSISYSSWGPPSSVWTEDGVHIGCDYDKQGSIVFSVFKETNNCDEYVVEQSSGLQISNLSKVTGKKLFTDSQRMVYPAMGCPDASVVSAARRLVGEHVSRFSQAARILQQRQTIEMIPVSKVTYSWKGESNSYFVYGSEYKVHTDDYPAPCCCSVM